MANEPEYSRAESWTSLHVRSYRPKHVLSVLDFITVYDKLS
jgi:hypothetical protein